MTSDTHDVDWLSTEQQHAWRAYLVGTTLLMDRLDRDLRASHDISLPEYEVLVRLSESPDHRVRMATLADSLSHSRSRVTHTVTRLERAGLVERVGGGDHLRCDGQHPHPLCRELVVALAPSPSALGGRHRAPPIASARQLVRRGRWRRSPAPAHPAGGFGGRSRDPARAASRLTSPDRAGLMG